MICKAIGCKVVIKNYLLMCGSHYRLIPNELKRRLQAARDTAHKAFIEPHITALLRLEDEAIYIVGIKCKKIKH